MPSGIGSCGGRGRKALFLADLQPSTFASLMGWSTGKVSIYQVNPPGSSGRNGVAVNGNTTPATSPETSLHHLVEVMKQRWACELTHRELKQEVGLDHFEGRSWRGLHHHALLCMVALLFLQWLRLSQPDDLMGDSVPAIRKELAAVLLPACLFRGCPCTGLFSGP